MARYVIRVARQAAIVLLFVMTALAGAVSGVLFAYADDLPQISALDDYAPSTITRVYAAGGESVGEFALQRRTVTRTQPPRPVDATACAALLSRFTNTCLI